MPIPLLLLVAAPLAEAGAPVAAAVETAFPQHDVNGDGKLSRAEFSAWMLQLKARSDPAAKRDRSAARAWAARAFVRADIDRSAGVTAAELTGFLTRASS